MSYLLDTSAWLAHLFGEPGVEEVTAIFEELDADASISVLAYPEMYGRLKALQRQAQWRIVRDSYAPLFVRRLPVDEQVAAMAVELRAATTPRLPTIDALIAATAVVYQLTLVHRDPHMAAISHPNLHQKVLPDKD